MMARHHVTTTTKRTARCRRNQLASAAIDCNDVRWHVTNAAATQQRRRRRRRRRSAAAIAACACAVLAFTELGRRHSYLNIYDSINTTEPRKLSTNGALGIQ